LAEDLVSEVEHQKDEEARKIYGGLCHSFPVLVRTCGLCQALAFSEAKKASGTNGRALAHRLLLEHVGKVLGITSGDILSEVRKADASKYMFYTRRVLDAWIYFKRFAVSILKVESAKEAQDG